MRRLPVLLLLVAAAAAADDIRLTPDERTAEVQWLTSLGLKVPAGGILLESPYAAPLTRRSVIAPTAWWNSPSPKTIRADLLRPDITLLRLVMEKAYGGWNSAAARGWNWDRWFSDWDRDLAARVDASLDIADAFAPFAKLMDFQLDNHTGFADGSVRLGSGSRSAILERPATAACTALRTASGEFALDSRDPAQRPIATRIVSPDGTSAPGVYVSYPSRRGEVTAIRCGDAWIPLRTWGGADRMDAIAALAQHGAGEPSYRTVSPQIGYLRLPAFTKENNEILRKLLPGLPATAGHEKLVIVDMRRNGGGDNVLYEMRRWIDSAAVQRVLPGKRVTAKSCLYDALRWGYTQMSSRALTPPLTDALRRSLQFSLDAVFQSTPEGCPATAEEVKSQWDFRQHTATGRPPAGKPRLLLLVDNGCGSDCEYMTYALGAEPGTVIAGESTYGVAQFVQPGYFILPHTRVKFRIALGMSDQYGDGRSFDGYGFGVDMLLAGEEAHRPETILKLAATLIEP
jgi:hypothetical protein